jgi:hypothetical protein
MDAHQLYVAAQEQVRRPRARVRWGRTFFVGILLGLLATGGALAYEATWIRDVPQPPDTVTLERTAFSAIGCSIAYPAAWTVEKTKRRVTILSREVAKDRSTRGLRASATDVAFKHVGSEISRLVDRLGSYRAIDTTRKTVDGQAAVVHVFIADDLRFEQWWIDRGKTTLRIDLWSRPADDNAPQLNARIVRSVDLL